MYIYVLTKGGVSAHDEFVKQRGHEMIEFSAKAQRAIRILRAGGHWRRETAGNRYSLRLLDEKCRTVHGIDFQTKNELESAGLLRWSDYSTLCTFGSIGRLKFA